MQPKKTPNANLENKKWITILLAFVMVLSCFFIVMEWSSKTKIYTKVESGYDIPMEFDIPQTVEILPPPPPPPAQVIVQLNVVEDDTPTTSLPDFNPEDDPNEGVVPQAPIPQPVEEEAEVEFVVIADKMPVFKGGPSALNSFLRKTIKYPTIPAQTGIQGKVICQFVVNKDGTIVDVQVVKGVDPALDKEALRVIKSMPAWEAGEQRGKPVRVKFTLPITFKLAEN